MESENTTTETILEAAPKKTPTFIIVLCILTFLGSGYGIYKGITGYFTADAAASMVSEVREKVSDQMDGKPNGAMAQNMVNGMLSNMSADNIRKSSIFQLISCIITLAGAILMWGLRKMGFYIYVGGTVIGIAGPFVVFGASVLAAITAGFGALFGILFVILYGVNLKHMTK